MKHRILVAALFCCSVFAWAAPETPEYSMNVHVNTSRMVQEGTSTAHHQKLSVVIDGKKYELESIASPNALLALGDYKARIVKDHHNSSAYDVWRIYELLLPDNKVRQFLVVGESE